MGTDLFPGLNRPGEVALTTNPKESVEIYPYYPFGAQPDFCIMGTELFPGVNRPGEVALTTYPKESIEIYPSYPSGPAGQVYISMFLTTV